MKKTNSFKDYLTYSWYIVLLVFVLSYALSYYLVSYKTEYKKEELFSIFVTSYGVKDQELQNRILNECQETDIKEVNIYNFSYEDENIASYYANFGEKSDLIVLYETDLLEMKEFIGDRFLLLNNTYSENYQTYNYENCAYGIKVFDFNNKENSLFDKYFNFEGKINKDSYVLINKKSVHFENENAIGYKILNKLLKGEL